MKMWNTYVTNMGRICLDLDGTRGLNNKNFSALFRQNQTEVTQRIILSIFKHLYPSASEFDLTEMFPLLFVPYKQVLS